MERKNKRQGKAGKTSERSNKNMITKTSVNKNQELLKSKVCKNKENSLAVKRINRRGSHLARYPAEEDFKSESKRRKTRRRRSGDQSELFKLDKISRNLSKQNSQVELQIKSINTEIEPSRESSLMSLDIENLQEKLFAKNEVISKLQLEVSKLTSINDGLLKQLAQSRTEIASLKDQLSLAKA